MMIHQYTAAALVSEDKVLAHPASVDSIPTSANQEDHVSMGSIAARHARAIVAQRGADRGHRAARRAPRRSMPGWRCCPGRDRARASPRRIAGSGRSCLDLEGDREPGPDLAAAVELVRNGALADLVEPA